MSINLHLLNAQGKLSTLENKIISEFTMSINRITSLIPVQDVDVVISASSDVIPETGFGGFCPEDDLVYIKVDPNNSNLLHRFSEEFTAILGHELHHCIRRRKVGYGFTLAEALVTEGLACSFETELRTMGAPFYAVALKENELNDLWDKAKLELSSKSYDHVAWFCGCQSRFIPRHAGYSLGYNVVNEYISEVGVPASRLSAVLASEVLNKG
ncbi:hypothetical protein AB0536_004460 [Vibrio parahaemolyticus]